MKIKTNYTITIDQYSLIFSIFSFFLYLKPLISNIIITDGVGIFAKIMITTVAFILISILNLILFNKYTIKTFTILFFIINAIILYFMNNFAVMFDYNAISNTFETNFSEAIEFINIKLILYFIFFGIMPIIIFLKLFTIKNNNTFKNFLKSKILYLSCLITILLLSVTICFFNKNYSYFIKKNRILINYLLPINYIKSIIDFYNKNIVFNSNRTLIKLIDLKDQNVKNTKNNKKNLVVFILGESARANNFSFNNYNIKTNELLENYNLINFSNFYSCGTSTFISVPCIFSHLDRKNYTKKNFLKYENLLDIFKNLEYQINWYSNNGTCKNVCDRADNFKIISDGYDIKLLDNLKSDVLNNIDKNLFIVLHQRGSHGPKYIERYPEGFEKFKPVCNKDLYDCNKKSLINTYNNTIYYTSYVIKETIDFLKTQEKYYNILLIYVSDHGESLGENKQFMHGYPYFIANDYQKHVPFMLWFSDDFIKYFNVNIQSLNNIKDNKLSQDNIFHSILGIFDIKSKYYDDSLDIFKIN